MVNPVKPTGGKPAPVKAAPAKPAPAVKPSLVNKEPPWITIARKYVGIREGVGDRDNPAVVAMYARAGFPGVKHDSVPWCAAYVGACLREAGYKSTGTLWALDYADPAKFGKLLPSLAVGAIGTKTRNGGGHVFFIVGFNATHVFALGGNQGDRVCIVPILRTKLHRYAWPANAPPPDFKNRGQQTADAVAGSEA